MVPEEKLPDAETAPETTAEDAPATPERVLWGCEQMRKSLSGDQHE